MFVQKIMKLHQMNYFFFIFKKREITFDNAEELTEEGLPLMVLFYHPNNTIPIKHFKEKVEAELISEKRKKNHVV